MKFPSAVSELYYPPICDFKKVAFKKIDRGKKVFNFHMTPDIWDAVIFETSFRFNDDCKVREINF